MELPSNPIYLLKKLVLQLAKSFGYVIVPIGGLQELEGAARLGRLIKKFSSIEFRLEQTGYDKDFLISNSKSQLGQDLVALSVLPTKLGGFFVEFGATNGVDGSNTYLLEKFLGWKGILSEPARTWRDELEKNREATIDLRCVYNQSGLQLKFQEAAGGLSTLSYFASSDIHALARRQSRQYTVESVSLNDLLSEHKAPSHIDFLSIDTEGSELLILLALDFSKYSFGFICVEHNFTENRKRIQELLESNGYSQVYPELSDFDDWFVPRIEHASSR
jgi:FkbM family methyltransferase